MDGGETGRPIFSAKADEFETRAMRGLFAVRGSQSISKIECMLTNLGSGPLAIRQKKESWTTISQQSGGRFLSAE
jgi:hypothetical protein